jgi:hypothetical protein
MYLAKYGKNPGLKILGNGAPPEKFAIKSGRGIQNQFVYNYISSTTYKCIFF